MFTQWQLVWCLQVFGNKLLCKLQTDNIKLISLILRFIEHKLFPSMTLIREMKDLGDKIAIQLYDIAHKHTMLHDKPC